jgi:hypothetical protein
VPYGREISVPFPGVGLKFSSCLPWAERDILPPNFIPVSVLIVIGSSRLILEMKMEVALTSEALTMTALLDFSLVESP